MSQLSAVGNDLPLPRSQAYRDWLGGGASVLCAIHCAAMPFVIGFLPLLGLSFLADPAFHQWMVVICLALALLAFVPGWRRHHRLVPAAIGLTGLTLITVAAFAGPEECCPSCPPAEEPGVMTVAGPPTPLDAPEGPSSTVEAAAMSTEKSCGAGCCPEEDSAIVTAGAGGFMDSEFMSLVWLWMTPIGGVILVVAHLANHRFSTHCKMACCSSKGDAPAAA